MPLHEISQRALSDIQAIDGIALTDQQAAEVLAAIDRALQAATALCGQEHASVVAAHLEHATGVAAQINEESDRRRGLLIANLSAMR